MNKIMYLGLIALAAIGLAVGLFILNGGSEVAPSRADQPVTIENVVGEITHRRQASGLSVASVNSVIQKAAESFATLMAAEQSNYTPTSKGVAIISLIDRSRYPFDPSKRETAWLLMRSSASATVGEALAEEFATPGSVGKEVLAWSEARAIGVGVAQGTDGYLYTAILFGSH